MHRLLVDSCLLASDCPTLSEEASRHLRVLRPKDGEEVELFDGHGRTRCFAYRAAARALASIPGRGLAVTPRAPGSLTLFACVTKGSRWDWTIEKAVELGVTRIVPVISDRTIVRIPKEERAMKRLRWLRIVEDAARQSDAVWMPEVCEAVDFTDTLPLVRECSCYVGALMDPPARLMLDVLIEREGGRVGQARDLAVYVGPEGDFTPAELSALLEVATPVSFGTSILRAETAAIFGVSVLAAVRGLTLGAGDA